MSVEEAKKLEERYSKVKTEEAKHKANHGYLTKEKAEIQLRLAEKEKELKDKYGINSIPELEQRIGTLRGQIEGALVTMESKLGL